jgi:hypothetical protein
MPGKGQSQNFVDSTQLEAIPSLKNKLWQVSDMAYAKGWLFFQDQKPKYGIQVYNPRTGEKEYEFGRTGRGPGEYQSFTIQRGPGPGLIEISDVDNKKNDIYDVSCLKKKPPASEAHKCIIKTEKNLASRQALILNNEMVLNQGATTGGFLFLSKNQKKLKYLSQTPEEIKEKYKRPLHQSMSMTGSIASNSDRTKFAYFADSFNWALFFERKGDRVEFLREYEYSFLPEFTVKKFGRSSMLVPAKNYRSAFEYPVSGQKHYFVLYSGKSSEDVKKEGGLSSTFTNRIKVFNWKGKEITEIFLSENVGIFTTNYNEDMVYAITFNKNSEATVLKAPIK